MQLAPNVSVGLGLGRLWLVLTYYKKPLFWAFPPHPNMGETFSSNSEPSRHLP